MTSLFAPRDLPIIMGVVNVTPDSFSDGGSFATPERAINHGLYLREQGANIIDVGGESTRPGADPVDAEQELARVLPVVQGLVAARAIVSVDTRQPLVMQAVLAAGAQIINDISAATHDPASLNIMAQHGAHVVLMHMQGQPQSMQEAPDYQDVVPQVTNFLRDRAQACVAAGIAQDRIAVDPGIGFGKTVPHNLSLLKHLDHLVGLGYPVLLGTSRKSFIAKLSRSEPPGHRLAGSLSSLLWAVQRGVGILRVHDVAETVQALKIWHAITQAD